MENIFFFQTQQITDSSIFNQFKEQKIFFSYFQVDNKYYIFLFSQKSIDINFISQLIDLIQELDSKQRKIRSFRGYFLYALEILQNGEDYEILKTNLQPFFWKKVKDIIRQNKKGALLPFLFGSTYSRGEVYPTLNTSSSPDFDPKIQTLQNQVDSLAQQVQRLQQKLTHLEKTILTNSKYPLSDPRKALNDIKITQHNDSTMEVKKRPYLTSNDTKRSPVPIEIRDSIYRGNDSESKSLSETSKIDLKHNNSNEHYNLSSNQEKGLKKPNFITLSNLSEAEKIEIIKKGFELQAKQQIPLKKYYESKQEYSLFQFKGYSIKYEAIRKNKFYQQLKQ